MAYDMIHSKKRDSLLIRSTIYLPRREQGGDHVSNQAPRTSALLAKDIEPHMTAYDICEDSITEKRFCDSDY